MLLTLVSIVAVYALWLGVRVARLERQLAETGEPQRDPDARMKATGRQAWYGHLLNRVK
jgi:hypothetical protein